MSGVLNGLVIVPRVFIAPLIACNSPGGDLQISFLAMSLLSYYFWVVRFIPGQEARKENINGKRKKLTNQLASI